MRRKVCLQKKQKWLELLYLQSKVLQNTVSVRCSKWLARADSNNFILILMEWLHQLLEKSLLRRLAIELYLMEMLMVLLNQAHQSETNIVLVAMLSNETGVPTQTHLITYQGLSGSVEVMSLWESQKWSNLLYCTLL